MLTAKVTVHTGDVSLPHEPLVEGTTGPLPGSLFCREDLNARRERVEPMDDARPETALSDSERLRAASQQRVEYGSDLVEVEGVGRSTGRLVDGEKPVCLPDHGQVWIGHGPRALGRMTKRIDLDLVPGAKDGPLRRGGAVVPEAPACDEPVNVPARDPERFGDEGVEADPTRRGRDRQVDLARHVRGEYRAPGPSQD